MSEILKAGTAHMQFKAAKYEERIAALSAENDRLREALTTPDADRRQWFLSELVTRQGYFNRRDLCEAFGISVPQAAIDIARWLKTQPLESVTYNKSAKRYEVRR